ncbi:T9SS type A sorting domain-containing protein [candidate division GN15 bacterium]|nr:T9SS type A sorting domain-containing protein [candidate division GN15 bacterium]
MDRKHRKFRYTLLCLVLVALAATGLAADKVYFPERSFDNEDNEPVIRDLPSFARGMKPGEGILPLDRKHPWALPEKALAADWDTTIHILVLRYNFQYETVDNPNTTGRGHMDFSNPITDPASEQAYLDSVGYIVDPPPHDSTFFAAHMQALHNYWYAVSDGRISITWDIWPRGDTATYQLPEEMSHYGFCVQQISEPRLLDSVVAGLERYFVDCIQTADNADPEIDFSDYGSIFLFHAGVDAQNDIFRNTCSDLFSGYIRFFTFVPVDNDSNAVQRALILPETVAQDNRAVALNGLIAHEFCHELGGVDLYNTSNFYSLIGDFALMDHNGENTGLLFPGYQSSIFGAMPVYPSAWTRAYLGLSEVEEVRSAEDVRLIAAGVDAGGRPEIIKVPISEYQYYLIENRTVDIDGKQTAMLADPETNVFRGPGRLVGQDSTELTSEYDFMLPAEEGGVLIYLVDEVVAALDTLGNGFNNFFNNSLQWDPQRQFVTLMEGDGVRNFNGQCPAGCGFTYQWYGWEGDMFREDRQRDFTPNTVLPAIDNLGNNPHIYIENIRRDTTTIGDTQFPMDTVVRFSVSSERQVDGFPTRIGVPTVIGKGPVAEDLDSDGSQEIIAVSRDRIIVSDADGNNWLRDYTNCTTCPTYYDTATLVYDPDTTRSLGGRTEIYPLNLFAQTPNDITAGPVAGQFSGDAGAMKIAIGYPAGTGDGWILTYQARDNEQDGQADFYLQPKRTTGKPITVTWNSALACLTDSGIVYTRTDEVGPSWEQTSLFTTHNWGMAAVGDSLFVLAGNEDYSSVYAVIDGSAEEYPLDTLYEFGPIVADIDRKGILEVVVASSDGRIAILSFSDELAVGPYSFDILAHEDFDATFTTDPIIADIDNDNRPDILIGGINKVYAFNERLISLADYPIEVSDRFLSTPVAAAPITADIRQASSGSSVLETVFPTTQGSIYAFGPHPVFGYPLPVGLAGYGSPVYWTADGPSGTEGRLSYAGLDGWLYAWVADADQTPGAWPMAGYNARGSSFFPADSLGDPTALAGRLPEDQMYNYPNPVTTGSTTIRYVLGSDARSVDIAIFDLSGTEVRRLDGQTTAGINELNWTCDGVTPGVYRCMIEADFDGTTEHGHFDIAVIR